MCTRLSTCALDDDERNALANELLRDNEAHAAEAADDEVVGQLVEHAFTPPAHPAALEVPLDDPRHHERETVKDGRNPDGQHHHREELASSRHRVDFLVAGGRDRDDRHVQGVPHAPSFDHHVADRSERHHS
jgi:hypothetical protein